MGISLKFTCPSCQEDSSLRRESSVGLPQTGTDVTCSSCGNNVPLPENVEFIPDDTEAIIESSSDYSTLRFIGKINSFIGWLAVGVGVLMIIVGLGFNQFGFVAIGLPGFGLCLFGLLVVASGQMISCFVDTERHTRDSSETLKQILEKMTEEKSE